MSSTPVKQSCTSATSMSAGPTPAIAYACFAAFTVGGNVVMSALCWCITRSSPRPTPRTHTGRSV